MGVVMRKRQKQLHRPKHVLLEVRKIIRGRAKESKDTIGLAMDTVKSITSGRLTFGHHAAATVARVTGIAYDCLLSWQPGKQLKTSTGEPFTEETYNRHRMQLEAATAARPGSRKRGNEAFRLYILLCVKVGRVLLAAQEGTAAQPEGDIRFAAWKLRDELNRIGNLYPTYDSNRKVYAGPIVMRSVPERFDHDLQILMGRKKPLDYWRSILTRFHRDLAAIEHKQAESVASQAPSKSAKPGRR